MSSDFKVVRLPSGNLYKKYSSHLNSLCVCEKNSNKMSQHDYT